MDKIQMRLQIIFRHEHSQHCIDDPRRDTVITAAQNAVPRHHCSRARRPFLFCVFADRSVRSFPFPFRVRLCVWPPSLPCRLAHCPIAFQPLRPPSLFLTCYSKTIA